MTTSRTSNTLPPPRDASRGKGRGWGCVTTGCPTFPPHELPARRTQRPPPAPRAHRAFLDRGGGPGERGEAKAAAAACPDASTDRAGRQDGVARDVTDNPMSHALTDDLRAQSRPSRHIAKLLNLAFLQRPEVFAPERQATVARVFVEVCRARDVPWESQAVFKKNTQASAASGLAQLARSLAQLRCTGIILRHASAVDIGVCESAAGGGHTLCASVGPQAYGMGGVLRDARSFRIGIRNLYTTVCVSQRAGFCVELGSAGEVLWNAHSIVIGLANERAAQAETMRRPRVCSPGAATLGTRPDASIWGGVTPSAGAKSLTRREPQTCTNRGVAEAWAARLRRRVLDPLSTGNEPQRLQQGRVGCGRAGAAGGRAGRDDARGRRHDER
jgi:hypothetical protein